MKKRSSVTWSLYQTVLGMHFPSQKNHHMVIQFTGIGLILDYFLFLIAIRQQTLLASPLSSIPDPGRVRLHQGRPLHLTIPTCCPDTGSHFCSCPPAEYAHRTSQTNIKPESCHVTPPPSDAHSKIWKISLKVNLPFFFCKWADSCLDSVVHTQSLLHVPFVFDVLLTNI